MQCKAYRESGVPEFVSAMAAGWNAQVILETWSQGSPVSTSIGLAVSSRHMGGRHVCIVPDKESWSEYTRVVREAGSATEVIVGDAEEAVEGVVGVDFMVVDCRQEGFWKLLRTARLEDRGAVLVCKNASSRAMSGFRWQSVLEGGGPRHHLVRSVFLPVGKGLDIAYVGAGGGGTSGRVGENSRWIKRIDHKSGEEIIIRK